MFRFDIIQWWILDSKNRLKTFIYLFLNLTYLVFQYKINFQTFKLINLKTTFKTLFKHLSFKLVLETTVLITYLISRNIQLYKTANLLEPNSKKKFQVLDPFSKNCVVFDNQTHANTISLLQCCNFKIQK